MESFAVLPSNADYTKVLPLAVESRSRRRTFFPVNGQSFTSDGNNIIRIDLSAQAFLDPKHSYLRFRFTNTTGAGNTMGFDFGGGHSFIERLRIEQAGNVLCDTNNYNKLMSSIILPAQGGMESVATRSITEGQRFANSAANQANAGPANEVSGAAITTPTNSDVLIAAANGTYNFCIPLMNGLIGTTQDKLVPLQLLGSSPLTIEIQLAPSIDIGVFAGGADPTGYTLSDVRYIAQLVEVGPEVDANLRMVQELSGGRLVMNGVDYTHFSGNVPANSTGNVSINVPARRKSLKSLFFVGASNTFGAGAKRAAYNLSFGGNFNMTDYQLKVGSVVYPPTPVDCQFGANPELSRSEAASELAKCFGTLGSVNGLGSLNTTNYASTDCLAGSMVGASNAAAAMSTYKFAPFGLDLEAFQRTAIESGVNTADQSLPITLTINVGVAINEAINVDAYVAYDALYFIDEVGNIRVSM